MAMVMVMWVRQHERARHHPASSLLTLTLTLTPLYVLSFCFFKTESHLGNTTLHLASGQHHAGASSGQHNAGMMLHVALKPEARAFTLGPEPERENCYQG